MTSPAPVALVLAKAPEPGLVKTRLAADVGAGDAADLAAAALLDTLDVCEEVFGPDRCHLALTGNLEHAVRGAELTRRLARWSVHAQRGDGLGARIAAAHADVHHAARAPVVQLGMDTPQVPASTLHEVADLLRGAGDTLAVLGPALDGGWWVLGVTDPEPVHGLHGLTMSLDTTYADTRRALLAAGARVEATVPVRDIDTATDADVVAGEAPALRFSRTWRATEVFR